jgi:hypothetical protein
LTSDAGFHTSFPHIFGHRRGQKTEAGKAKIAAAARITTAKRWEEAKATGQNRIAPYSEEGMASLVAFNTGRRKTKKTRELIRQKALEREARKRLEAAQALILAMHKPRSGNS